VQDLQMRGHLEDIEEFEEKSGFLKICHKMYLDYLPVLVG
jgi:hypothetical protein